MATKQQIEKIYKRKLSAQEEAMRRIDDQEEQRVFNLPKRRVVTRPLVTSEKVQGLGPFQDNI